MVIFRNSELVSVIVCNSRNAYYFLLCLFVCFHQPTSAINCWILRAGIKNTAFRLFEVVQGRYLMTKQSMVNVLSSGSQMPKVPRDWYIPGRLHLPSWVMNSGVEVLNCGFTKRRHPTGRPWSFVCEMGQGWLQLDHLKSILDLKAGEQYGWHTLSVKHRRQVYQVLSNWIASVLC